MAELVQIFYEPGKVFDAVREKRIWLPAFLLCMVLLAVTTVTMIRLIGMDAFIQKSVESRSASLTPEQIQQQTQAMSNPAIQSTFYIAPPVVIAVVILLIALIFFTVMAMSGSRIGYTQALGVVSYGYLPFMVLGLLLTVLILLFSPDRSAIDMRNPIPTNVGAFLDKANTSKPLYALAGSLDLIVFGEIAMMAYGLSKVTRKSFASMAVTVFVLWLIFVIVKVGWAALFGR